MKKKLLALALMCTVIGIGSLVADSTPATVLADTGLESTEITDESGYTYTIDEETKNATITGYTGTENEIVIPEKIDGYSVTKIGQEAFYNNSNITSLVIPSTITMIDKFAFDDCKNLTKITLMEGKDDAVINSFAFASTGITHITIPGNYKKIGSYAFYHTYLTSVIYEPSDSKEPDQTIEEGAFDLFAYSDKIELYLSSSVGKISDDAFSLYFNSVVFFGEPGTYAWQYASENEIDFFEGSGVYGDYGYDYIGDKAAISEYFGSETELYIPSSIAGYTVTEIGDYAFYKSDITKVTLPSTITEIGKNSFEQCKSLKTVILRDGTEDAVIEQMAFHSSGVGTVTIAGNYKKIGRDAFYWCRQLDNVHYKVSPSGVADQIISDRAFGDCPLLRVFYIPSTILEIDKNTFDNTNRVEFRRASSSEFSEYVLNYGKEHNIDCTTKSGIIKDGFRYKISSGKAVITGYSIQYIDSMYRPLEEPTELVIPAQIDGYKVEKIGIGAFEDNMHIISYVIPEGVTTIGEHAFDGSVVKNVYMPSTLTRIGEYAFSCCENLGNVYLKKGEKAATIANYAFHNSYINSISIPANYTHIGQVAFNSCDNLTKVIFETDGIVREGQEIYSNAFLNCKAIETVVIPSTVTGLPEINRYGSNLFEYSESVTIYGNKGSVACNYAIATDIPFVAYENTATLRSDVAPVAVVGNTVTLDASESTGYGKLQYRYYIYDNDTAAWTPLTEYVTDSSYEWVADKSGKFEFCVDVKDETGAQVRSKSMTSKVLGNFQSTYTGLVESENKWYYLKDGKFANTYTGLVEYDSKWYSIKAGIGEELETLEGTVSVDVSSVVVGDKVKISVEVDGGYGPYTYTYKVYNETTKKWATLKSDSTSNEYVWKAGSEGERVFYVDITDATGETVRCKSSTVACLKAFSATLKTSNTIVIKGDKVTLTVSSIGGSGSYTYTYKVYNQTTKKWATLKSDSTSNKYTWTAGSVGTRIFYVDVKDSTGNTIRCESAVVTCTEPLDVSIKTNGTTVEKGDKITLTATATGGTAPYTYSFLVYNVATKKWYRFNESEFLKNNKLTWKASGTGKRKFFVEVKDTNGKVVRSKGVTITIK